jgi:alkanesulfonate monooxygenase SsuD/methylene tetrahydromethanopterin reductase-like flavin-dependent oxidoreductase (luciferase family)
MEFGIFSNGFRAHTSAGRTYDEDIAEIVLADQLGFRDAYISEHHGEVPYIDNVDTIPAPELMICKAAALTKHIRMGAAVKLIHLHHPLDTAVQAAVTDHLVGGGRYIFGFGGGFGNPAFSLARGLTFEDRNARLQEALEFVLKCWRTQEPFDWDGVHWKGKDVLCLPKPVNGAGMPMAIATDNADMVRLAGERGYILLSSFIESASKIRARNELYSRHARLAGHDDPLKNCSVARAVYIAGSRREAIEDMRAAIAVEVAVQAQRGFLGMLKAVHGLDVPNDSTAIDYLVGSGLYVVGDPDEVSTQLKAFHDRCGGFGAFLITTGKDWATPEKRARSMRLFMENVAPRMRSLLPMDLSDVEG